ncbi:carbohydrate-binding protein [Cohnella fermenti]|uniref:Carbohydrate-binding protein n=2 Tax=Cohnella fermenti TaxID=2565925 RepID=A0A4S4BKZ1_9BACL|nr:carbohydrate-binding protein [Cohnella fermenti]
MLVALLLAYPLAAGAVTTGNGALVYSPTASETFDNAGTTYARIITLKNSGSSYNGQLIATFDQLKEVSGQQVYPIYRSTDNGATWSLIANVKDTTYGTTRTSQPMLFEVPQTVGSLSAGTLLLAGNIFPEDGSSSRIVIWKSTDHGSTWSLLSTVDTGGPTVYDPSTTSTTTTIWEPFLGLDSSGNLVCYYSDERQKSSNILQALVLRKSTDGGATWGAVTNVVAVANNSDRPGMITVTKLPNGKYMATYEVVNKPSISLNTAPVYYKFSDDGVTWTASDLGTPIKLKNGRGIGSSPYVKWVPAGGPNGMVIVSAKWGLDSSGNISGGQNFYVNYNLGLGDWERLPMAVTYDASDTAGGYFSGFAQSFDTSVDGLTLYQATNVENLTTGRNDIRVGTIPLNANRYEAERATLSNVSVGTNVDASGGSEVQYINYSTSSVTFNVNVPTSGTYTVNVRYSNGNGSTSTHAVSVNGGTASTISYPATVDWNRYQWAQMTASLNAGSNTIKFSYNTGYAELDMIDVYKSGTALSDEFWIVNRNSGKLLEVYQASTANGGTIDQWGDTGYSCQRWTFTSMGSGYYKIINKNSAKLLEVYNGITTDGAVVDQWSDTSTNTQQWLMTPTDTGYFKLSNRNSGKLLEVYANSSADGAIVDQWSDTGYNCQQWTLVKEGTK